MNRSPLLSLLALGGLVALPSVGSAATHSDAMNSCVSAFMQSLAQRSVGVKLRDSRLLGPVTSPGLFTSSTSQLVLTATDTHDYHTVARGLCQLDAHGRMIGFEEIPAASAPLLD